MPLIEINGLHFKFSDSDEDVLDRINWSADEGEVHLLIGASGSGKSTFLRSLNGLIPHFHGGKFGGDVNLAGLNTREHGPRELAGITGTVFQDPESQMVTDTVEDEIVFGMESLGFAPATMRTALERVLDQFALQTLRFRETATLSGGERQKVALAAATITQPQVLLLDEPTSQLDPDSAREVLDAIKQIMLESAPVAIVAEHRLDRMLPMSSHIVELSDNEFSAGTRNNLLPMLADVPPLVQFGRRAGLRPLPLTPDKARSLLSHQKIIVTRSEMRKTSDSSLGDQVMTVEDLSFQYQDQPVLRNISFQSRQNERIALIGRNGSGKSTLLKLLIGLIRADHGHISIRGVSTSGMSVQEIARFVGFVPQHATGILHQESLRDELDFTLRVRGIAGDVAETLDQLGIGHFGDRHPLDISGGERQRAGIAAIAVARPDVLLLDEPTRGLPAADKHVLGKFIVRYASEGRTVVVATHDMDFVANYTTRALLLQDQRVESDGDTREVMSGSNTFTTQLNQVLGRNIIKLDDIVIKPENSPLDRLPVLTQNQAD